MLKKFKALKLSDKDWVTIVEILSNYLPKGLEKKVRWENQTSRHLIFEITAEMENINRTQIMTDGTGLHYQGKSNLCWAFGINSGLRRALRQLVKKESSLRKSTKVNMEFNSSYHCPLMVVRGNKTVDEILADNSGWERVREYNVCSFQSMLANLICSVCPRSLEGVGGDGFAQSLIAKQPAMIEKVMERLRDGTLFEVPGWRRIIGCLKLLEAFGINPEHFKLSVEKVSHPNSAGFREFQSQLMLDKESGIVKTRVDIVPFPAMERTFKVSVH